MPRFDYVDNSVTLRKYWDYCQEVHYKKLNSIKTNSDKLIDNDPPDTFNRSKYVLSTRHFQETLKKKAIEEENKKIVTRLWRVSASKPYKDKLPQYKVKSMLKDKIKQDQLKIDIENTRLAKKLNDLSSTLNHRQFILDFEKNLKYKSLRAHPKAHTANKAPQVKLPYLDSKRTISNSNGELKTADRAGTNLSLPPEEVDPRLEYSDSEESLNTSTSPVPKYQGKYNSPPVNFINRSLVEHRLPEKIDL